MKAEYLTSDKLRKAHFVATGDELTRGMTIQFNPADLTPEQRETLLLCPRGNEWLLPTRLKEVEIDSSGRPSAVNGSSPEFDVIPDVAAWLAKAEAILAQNQVVMAQFETAESAYAVQRCLKLQIEVDEVATRIQDAIQAHAIVDTLLPYYHPRGEGERIGVDYAEFDEAIAAYKAALPEIEALAAAAQAAEKAKAEAAKAAERATRVAWAAERGSERLQRGLAAGHDCKRVYLLERAAFEFPDYILDLENYAEWKDRTCPSTEALDERDRVIAAHPELESDHVRIFWLTCEPRESKIDAGDGGFDPCECVAVHSPEYTHWLVRAL
jgi:hypothetical protein